VPCVGRRAWLWLVGVALVVWWLLVRALGTFVSGGHRDQWRMVGLGLDVDAGVRFPMGTEVRHG